jgi:GAF domain-containing protein
MKKVKPDSNSVSFLNQIINTQSCLAEADFNLQAFMQLTVDQMQKLTPATGVVVELADGDEMVYRAASGTVANYVGLRLKIENSISGLCIRTNKILRSNDTEIDSRVNIEACRKVEARSLIVAPLIHRGNAIGVLKILSRHANSFSDTDEHILQLMAGFIASGVAHQQFFETNQLLLHEQKLYVNYKLLKKNYSISPIMIF